MPRRSGTRVGIRTGFGSISTPVENLGPGTQFLLLLSETFRFTSRSLRSLFTFSSRGKGAIVVNFFGAAIGIMLYPVVFGIFFLITCGPWLVAYRRVKRAAALAKRAEQQSLPTKSSRPE